MSYETNDINGIKIRDLTVEEENELLRDSLRELQEELEKFRRPPLLVSSVVDIISPEKAIVRLNSGDFCVNVSRDLIGKLEPEDRVLLEQRSLTILEKIGKSKYFDVSKFVIIEKPNVRWDDIGGLDEQINELQEVIEMPLLYPEKFKKIGIEPPKGVLLYGPPGTGKTLLAKAVASNSNATFIEVVGSELVQKFIGEGAKFVKSIFELAREKAPSIIFIDEIDAIAAKRIEVGTSGEREVQRTFMQLLAEIDGFKPLGNVKIIGATNRLDILDPAIVRPGRLDRLIYVPKPDKKGRSEIFKIHTKKMNLAKNVDFEKLAEISEDLSGAEIKAVCTEAGYFALRKNRTIVKMEDFIKAIEKVRRDEEKKKKDKGYLAMYGELI